MTEKKETVKKPSLLKRIVSKLIMVVAIGIGLMIPSIHDWYEEQQFLKEYLLEEDLSPIVEIEDELFRKAFFNGGMDLNKDGQFSEYEADVFLEKERISRNSRRKGIGWIINGPTSLEGFQIFKTTQFISFSGTEIESLKPLEGLEQLDNLSITDANIVDVTPLTKMPSLNKATLYGNDIEDLSPLLEYYDREVNYNFDDNPLGRDKPNTVLVGYIPDQTRNYPVFESWNNIDRDKLMSSEIIKLDPIFKSKLIELGFDINEDGQICIYEAERIRGHLNLGHYSRDENDVIHDISGIQYFTGIKSLNLEDNEIENIDEIFNLKQLIWLDVPDNKISSIANSSEMPALVKFNIGGNPLESLIGVSNLKKLKVIYAGGCDFTSIKELYNLIDLKKIIINNNSVESINGIESLVNLEIFQASKGQIKDITSLLKMKKLKNISFTGNPLYNKETPNAMLVGKVLRYEVYAISE